MSNVLRILIVEDDARVRADIERAISCEKDMRVTGSAGTKREAEKLIQSYPFETLLIDLALPDGFGLETISWVTEKYPQSDIMVLAEANDDPHIVSAIEAGATGYILKSSVDKDLVSAIRLLQAGGSPVSPAVAQSVLRTLCTNTTTDRKSTRLNSSHEIPSRMPSSA